jgi:hypothetical protein
VQLEKTKANGLRIKPPKNGKVRVLPIGRMLGDAFRSHKAIQNAKRLVRGDKYVDLDFVFAQDNGALTDPDAFTAAFRKLEGWV